MSFSDIKVNIKNKIQIKYKNKDLISSQEMILADISHILSKAMKNGKIKSFEKVKIFIKNNNIRITSNIWMINNFLIILNMDFNI